MSRRNVWVAKSKLGFMLPTDPLAADTRSEDGPSGAYCYTMRWRSVEKLPSTVAANR